MAGINQHFIPQSLLRRFGHKKAGKATRVAVYERGNIFVTATTGAAAQRYFYSKLAQDGERTLDDKITDYEPRLAALFAELDSAASGSVVNAESPSELIAHLCIRNAQVRESFGHISGQLLGGALDMFTDPKKRWQLMGLDKSEPSNFLLEEFNKAYNASGLALRGMPRDQFLELCFASAKIQFNPSAPNPLPEFDAFAAAAREMAPNLAKNGHGRALEKGLVPEARRAALRALTWRVYDTDFDLVLPDCIAVDWPSPAHCRAFVYAPNPELTHVVMPIASRRYLVGAREERTHAASEINRVLAQCSWRFFIARDRADSFELLTSEIGKVTRAWADREIEDALAKVQIP